MARGTEWPEPEPLTEPLDVQPYPDEALPPILRDAVREAQPFVQAPMALVACSALSALSLAAQGLANVRRDHQLVGPISLYLLAVADSGARIRELLAQPLATDAHGCLTPAVLDLSPQARAEWIGFHDEVERELGVRGALRGVRDVAAKAAENAARLAALFHVLEHGASGTIASEEIRAAACIVGWHLNEARRLLADLDTPPSLAAAIRLDAWLRNEAQANDTDRVPTKRIYQYGPNCVRDSRDLRAALAVLAERGRARMEEDGRRRCVAINPALLDGRE